MSYIKIYTNVDLKMYNLKYIFINRFKLFINRIKIKIHFLNFYFQFCQKHIFILIEIHLVDWS